jgi:hypothetical protein
LLQTCDTGLRRAQEGIIEFVLNSITSTAEGRLILDFSSTRIPRICILHHGAPSQLAAFSLPAGAAQ